MLDQMSGGRIELGVGRGISPLEMGYYGVDPQTVARYLCRGARHPLEGVPDAVASITKANSTLQRRPIVIAPLQKPHPPLWYGANSLESADRLAKQGCNTVVGMKAEGVGQFAARYRAAWQALGRDEKSAAADRAQPACRRGRHRQGSAKRRQARLCAVVRRPDPSVARPRRRTAAPDDPRRVRASAGRRLHHRGLTLDRARAA